MQFRYFLIPISFLFILSASGQNSPETSSTATDIVKSTNTKTYKLKEVDYEPIFSKGKISQKDFLRIYLKYPTEAIEKGIEGTVILSFTINPDGEVTSPSILQGDHSLLNQEAIRIASLIPYYTPGYLNDVPVATQVLFPISFNLDEISSASTSASTIIPLDTATTQAPPLPEAAVLQAHIQPTSANGTPAPIYIIDGKMIDSNINLDASKIESIRVIKGSKALQLYGQGAKDGVIIITTKLYPDAKKD